MACAVATPLLEPSGDFPAWLEAQGVNEEVARAMDSELGIRDYGVLRACVRDGLVRAELLSTARDRLPFGFYAVLRQVVKALQGAEPHDPETPHWDAATGAPSYPGDVTLGGLVDVLRTLFSGLSRELQMCVQRLGGMDGNEVCTEYSPSPTTAVTLEDGAMHEIDDCNITDEVGENQNSEREEDGPSEILHTIKTEHFRGDVGLAITGVLSLVERKSNLEHVKEDPQIHQQQLEQQAGDEIQINADAEEMSSCKVNTHMPADTQHTSESQENLNHNFTPLNDKDMPLELQHDEPKSSRSSSMRNVNEKPEKKPFECTVCNKKFSRKYQFLTHQRMHTGEEKMIHSMCDLSYPQSSEFGSHEQTHEEEEDEEGEETHPCKFCDQSFAYKSMLTDHMHLHSEWRPYQCKICDSSFFRNDHLQMHVRTHTGLRPYQCKVCTRSFMRSHHLKVHERTHTGLRPYQCKTCNATFICSHHLKVHERKHCGP